MVIPQIYEIIEQIEQISVQTLNIGIFFEQHLNKLVCMFVMDKVFREIRIYFYYNKELSVMGSKSERLHNSFTECFVQP